MSITTLPQAFEIDRSKWLRNTTCLNSLMLDEHGNMCCLGFYAKACGIQDSELFEMDTPACVGAIPLLSESINNGHEHRNTPLASSLMSINDSDSWTDFEREDAIASSFAAVGIKVTFVGEGSPDEERAESLKDLYDKEE